MDRKKGFFFLCIAVGGLSLGIQVQMSANANFVADIMGLSGLEQGLLESLRESCGILALGVLALLVALAEPVIAGLMLILFGVGLAAYRIVPDYPWLVAASVAWSMGLHVWMPLPNSMALALAEPGKAGERLGQMRVSGSIGAFVGLIGALLLNQMGVALRNIFVVAGALALLAGFLCFQIPRNIQVPRQRFVIRRRYSLYYILEFLEGWRKQIFVTFAGFLLVKEYGVGLRTMLVLWLCIQLIGWFSGPWVGRLYDRVGERPVLLVYFLVLSVFFVGYATIRDVRLLYVIYVADSAMFVFAMGFTTYLNRIAPPADHTATLSMGVAFNHIAACGMPLVGGLLWNSVGSKWVFFLGAAVAVFSVIPVLFLPHRENVGAGNSLTESAT